VRSVFAPLRPFVSLALLSSLALALACDQPRELPAGPRESLAPDADQVFFGVDWNLTDAGVLKGHLRADTAFAYDEGTRMELRALRVTFFTATGRPSGTLVAREGTYRSRAGLLEARRAVVLVDTAGRRLTTEQLRYWQALDQVTSDSAFRFTEPGRALQGIGLTADPSLTAVRVHRVTGGDGGTFRLP